MEEFIPTFQENESNLLVQLDNFEKQIEIINDYSKQYDDLKKKIKTNMVQIGKDNDLEQIKWITPKGIQVTCSIGKKPIYEEQEVEEFNLVRLMEEKPEIYQEYLEKKTRDVVVQNGSNDRLVITLPKK